MDWVGNRGHDVRLPYNYLSKAEWNAIFDSIERGAGHLEPASSASTRRRSASPSTATCISSRPCAPSCALSV